MTVLRKKRFWFGLVITAVFLYLVFRQVEIHELADALAAADYPWLVPALGVYLGGYLVRALRWKILLRPITSLPWTRFLPPLMLGFMTNNLLPARAGEFVQAYVLGKREGLSKSSAFATVVMQRTLDGIVMVALALIVFTWFRLPFDHASDDFLQLVEAAIKVTAVLFAAVLAVLFALITWRDRAASLLSRLSRVLPAKWAGRVERILHSFLEGLSVLRHRGDSAFALLLTLGAWLLESAAYGFVLHAFGMDLPYTAAVMLMAVINLGIMVPSSPGYIGPFEFFGVGTLLLFGVAKHVSLPAVLVIHTIVWLPITLWGFYYLWTLRLSFQEIHRQVEAKEGM